MPPLVVSAQMVRFAVAAAEELPLAAGVALLALLELLELLELLLHAAAPVATAAASATAASARLLLRMVVSWMGLGRKTLSKVFEYFRRVAIVSW